MPISKCAPKFKACLTTSDYGIDLQKGIAKGMQKAMKCGGGI